MNQSAFKQLVLDHEEVYHSAGQPHKGCWICESVHAPSVECQEWLNAQPMGVELGGVPLTLQAQRKQKSRPLLTIRLRFQY